MLYQLNQLFYKLERKFGIVTYHLKVNFFSAWILFAWLAKVVFNLGPIPSILIGLVFGCFTLASFGWSMKNAFTNKFANILNDLHFWPGFMLNTSVVIPPTRVAYYTIAILVIPLFIAWHRFVFLDVLNTSLATAYSLLLITSPLRFLIKAVP